MSHIHLPDGVLPPLWWVIGYIVCFAVLGLMVQRVKGKDVHRRIPFVGVIAAMMLITMSVPLGIIPVHLSLAVLCGIMVGPSLGFIAVFVVNIILAMLGHGGITVVGINTLILGSEVIIGYYLFKLLYKHISITFAAVTSTIIALLVSTTLMVGVLGATVGIAEALPGDHDNEYTEQAQAGEFQIQPEEVQLDEGTGNLQNALNSINYLAFSGWGAVAIILLVGIFIESLVTGLIVNFFSKVRPDLIQLERNSTV